MSNAHRSAHELRRQQWSRERPIDVTQCEHRVSCCVIGISVNICRCTMSVYQHHQPLYNVCLSAPSAAVQCLSAPSAAVQCLFLPLYNVCLSAPSDAVQCLFISTICRCTMSVYQHHLPLYNVSLSAPSADVQCLFICLIASEMSRNNYFLQREVTSLVLTHWPIESDGAVACDVTSSAVRLISRKVVKLRMRLRTHCDRSLKPRCDLRLGTFRSQAQRNVGPEGRTHHT
jgi:hypothetical protein